MSDDDPDNDSRREPEKSAAVPGGQTVSQLLARILDQLSISAWLPAGALVFLLLLIGNLREADGDLGDAIGEIAKIDFPTVLLLIGAVVVATTMTQAFEFEAIRFLEGYWRPGRLRTAVADQLCRRHLAKREALEKRRQDIERKAFCEARLAMLERDVSKGVTDAVEANWLGRQAEGASEEDRDEAADIQWWTYARPEDRRRHLALGRVLRYYPSPHLMMPTGLGNTLRASEELVHDAATGPLEGFILERFDELPSTIQREHDQFRSRLDLYCSLLLVIVISGIVGVIALARSDATVLGITATLTLGFAWLSYRAAIVSARKYGLVLEMIAKLPEHDK